MRRNRWNRLFLTLFPLSFLMGCTNLSQRLTPTTASTPAIATILSITPQTPQVEPSQPAQMTASLAYSDGSVEKVGTVTWSITSSEVATVSAAGIVTCLKQGTSTLSAQAASLSASTTVTCIGNTVSSLSFLNPPSVIRSELPTQYHVIAHYSDGTTNDVTSLATLSTEASIATVSTSGTLLCNYPGTAALVASYSGTSVSVPFSCVIHSMPHRPGFVDSAATFEGPFASWRNVRTTFGAVGDGVHDDSSALQNALDSLAGIPAVLWLPRGTYVVTTPLHLKGSANVTIVGEDPLSTSLVWKGSKGGTLITFSGCMGLSVGRLTFDGSNQASELVELTWDDASNYYPTRNLFHDSRFVNAQTGLHTGWAGETTLDRVHFDHNTVAGISLGDWNALNFNIVDSLFTDNALGVTNIYGAGAFNVSNSVFERSTTADISIGNTGPFAFRSNLSVDSKRFLQTAMTGAAASITIQGNAISNPSSDPITIGSPGSVTLTDNTFFHLASEMHVLDGTGAAPLSFIAIGNSYAVSEPYGGYLGQYSAVDETTTADVSALPWIAPSEIYIPPGGTGRVYDLAPDTSETELQSAITAASTTGGIVHLPAGIFHVTQSLTVPPGAKFTLLGDGALTDLAADDVLSGPLLQLTTGQVQVKDLQISAVNASHSQPLLEMHVPDQPSTRVECDECATLATESNGFQIDGLDQALIEMKVATLGATAGGAAELIHGGPLHQQAVPAFGRINNFMASMSAYTVDQGAAFLTEDGWHDTGQGQLQMTIGDTASVTQQGGTIYVPLANTSFGSARGFKGSLNLLGTELNSPLDIQGALSPSILIAGAIQFSAVPLIQGVAQPSSVSYLNDWIAPANSSPTSLAASTLGAIELEEHFAVARSQLLTQRKSALSGSTEINMSRIVTTGYGFHVTSASVQSPSRYFTMSPLPSSFSTPSSGCTDNEASLAGLWTLQGGIDGSFVIASATKVLSESSVPNDSGLGVSLNSAAMSARDRWLIVPAGDGSFELINRATGDALTHSPAGCAYATADTQSALQQWILTTTPQ